MYVEFCETLYLSYLIFIFLFVIFYNIIIYMIKRSIPFLTIFSRLYVYAKAIGFSESTQPVISFQFLKFSIIALEHRKQWT